MFNGTLKWFQEHHENNLLRLCADHDRLILKAPTGSGKTILVTKFIDDYLDENPDTVFFWFCPGAGNLQDQSRTKFEAFTVGIGTGDVYDFISDSTPENSVYFINWDKINKSDNVVLRDGEDKNLYEKIMECRSRGLDFFMVVDEEHLNKKASEFYERTLAPRHVLRISATAKPILGYYLENIPDEEVIATGMIASGISVNENLTREVAYNDNYLDDLLLLRMADDKRKEILAEYQQRNLDIRPLVLIQFPAGKDEWIARVKSELAEMGYTEKNGLVTSWFSGEHPDEPEELSKLNGKYAFLLFKQAIATGWDCPRAKILVKLREGGTEAFNIQTVGRIRRMPERKHYDSELLDHCYLYTLDSEFEEGLTTALNDSFFLSRYMKKTDAPSFTLQKEYLAESDRQAVDDETLVMALHDKFLHDCDVNHDGMVTRQELEESFGFTFGTKLKSRAVEGIIKTTHDVKKLREVFCGEHEINMHDDGLLIRDAKRKIASAVGIDENITSKALAYMFDCSLMKTPQKDIMQMSIFSKQDAYLDATYKIITDMGHREFSAFLVNNWELLADIMRGVDQNSVPLDDVETELSMWDIPRMQDYKKHIATPKSRLMQKNVFDGYGTDILVQPNRSQPEIDFERWCENCPKVKWIYKNGDKGKDFFTLVYRVALRRYNFYPDYLIQLTNGEIWIIETKGGASASGETANIDKHAEAKMTALRGYAEANKVKFGFVRNMGGQLYISTTVWKEDMFNHDVWNLIEDVIN